MPLYTYACSECGRVRMFRPVKDHKHTICECGVPAVRADGDFCKNVVVFRPYTLFGHGGKEGTVISSKTQERQVKRGWENDHQWGDDREMVSPDEFDKMTGMSSKIPSTLKG